MHPEQRGPRCPVCSCRASELWPPRHAPGERSALWGFLQSDRSRRRPSPPAEGGTAAGWLRGEGGGRESERKVRGGPEEEDVDAVNVNGCWDANRDLNFEFDLSIIQLSSNSSLQLLWIHIYTQNIVLFASLFLIFSYLQIKQIQLKRSVD